MQNFLLVGLSIQLLIMEYILLKKSFPIISSLISKIVGNKWEKKRKQLDLVDSSLLENIESI